MPSRDLAPIGSPCWTDLWTSDVEGSRRFYSDLLGWQAQEPSPEFGVTSCSPATAFPSPVPWARWATRPPTTPGRSISPPMTSRRPSKRLRSAGAQILSMEVADLGIQAVLVDPSGADLGAWQPGTFPGFTVLNENGAPSWFELLARDYEGAVEFYRSVFHWETNTVGDSDQFRYSVIRDPSGEGELAGIMDAKAFLPEGVASHWSVYWEVDDVDASISKVKALGGSVVTEARDTPYGRLASAADPAGAQFNLRMANK